MFRILSLGRIDICNPTTGDARMVIGTLGSLALKGHTVLYVYLNNNKNKMKLHYDEDVVIKVEGKKSIIKIRKVIPKVIRFLNRNLLFKGETLKDVKNIVRNFSPDIIISENCNDPSIVHLARNISRDLKIPWIIRMDNLGGFFYKELYNLTHDPTVLIFAPFRISYYSIISRWASGAVAVSYRLEKALKGLGLKKITTIEPTYLPSYLESTSQQEKEKIREINSLESYGLMIERIGGSKHHRIYQKMFFKLLIFLAKKTPDINYIAVGPNKQWLKELANSIGTELPNNVYPIGEISSSSVLSSLYKKSSFVLIPDRYMPGVSTNLIETLYFGKVAVTTPAVAYSLRGLIHGKQAFIDNDYHRWDRYIASLAKDRKLLKSMEDEARKYFRNMLSWDIHAQRFEDLIAKILKT